MAERITKDMRHILSKIPEDKRGIARDVIDELIFMKRTLKELKQTINEKGAVVYSKGNMKESPAVKSYNQMIQRYGNLYKQIEMMLPKEEKEVEKNELAAFIGASAQ